MLLLWFFCRLGKDRIIFVTREDHETPSNAELIAEDPDDPYEEQGQSFSLCGGKVDPTNISDRSVSTYIYYVSVRKLIVKFAVSVHWCHFRQ